MKYFIDNYILVFRNHYENTFDAAKFKQLRDILEGLTKVTPIDLDNDGSDELYGDNWIISRQGDNLVFEGMGGFIKVFIRSDGKKEILYCRYEAEGTRELYFFALGIDDGILGNDFTAGPFSIVGYDLKDVNNDGVEELICYRSADLGWPHYYDTLTFPAIYEWTEDKFKDVTLLHKDVLISHYKKVIKHCKEEGFPRGDNEQYDKDICAISPEYKVFWEKHLKLLK